MTFAMTGVPWLDRTEHFARIGQLGHFPGRQRGALNTALRLGTNVQANGGLPDPRKWGWCRRTRGSALRLAGALPAIAPHAHHLHEQGAFLREYVLSNPAHAHGRIDMNCRSTSFVVWPIAVPAAALIIAMGFMFTVVHDTLAQPKAPESKHAAPAEGKSPTQPSAQQRPMPAYIEQAIYLIRSTLLTLNDANRSGNYTVLRDLADLQAREHGC